MEIIRKKSIANLIDQKIMDDTTEGVLNSKTCEIQIKFVYDIM